MHLKNIYKAGKSLQESDKALIMLHGRGASAGDILGLVSHLNVSEYAILAPQATNNTWYPYSFLANPDRNEPWLSSAIDLIDQLVQETSENGIAAHNIYFLGFSQGACLALEYTARNAMRYGGIAAFTGGLIGEIINLKLYSGNFNRTPFFISTGDPDPHVPVERVEKSVSILEKMDANVTFQVYENRTHTISQDELDKVNQFIFK